MRSEGRDVVMDLDWWSPMRASAKENVGEDGTRALGGYERVWWTDLTGWDIEFFS